MKFFSKIFQNFSYKSSYKFKFNLFFFRNMLSLKFNHLNNPHIFLPLKFLKIKIFKNNYTLKEVYLVLLIVVMLLVLSITLI